MIEIGCGVWYPKCWQRTLVLQLCVRQDNYQHLGLQDGLKIFCDKHFYKRKRTPRTKGLFQIIICLVRAHLFFNNKSVRTTNDAFAFSCHFEQVTAVETPPPTQHWGRPPISQYSQDAVNSATHATALHFQIIACKSPIQWLMGKRIRLLQEKQFLLTLLVSCREFVFAAMVKK